MTDANGPRAAIASTDNGTYQGGTMKDMFTRKVGSSRWARRALGVLALIVVASIAVGAMSASADRKAVQGHSGKLVGAWRVTADRPGLPPLEEVESYTASRNVITDANSGAARSAAHGAWQRIGAHTYRTTIVFFRYDAASGAYLGTVKIRNEIEVSHDGQSFTGVAYGELRDPAGNLLPGSNTRKDTITGHRINVEPLPVQP